MRFDAIWWCMPTLTKRMRMFLGPLADCDFQESPNELVAPPPPHPALTSLYFLQFDLEKSGHEDTGDNRTHTSSFQFLKKGLSAIFLGFPFNFLIILQLPECRNFSKMRIHATILWPWDFPGKNTGVGCHALLQGIFPTQGWGCCLMSPALVGGLSTTSTWEAQSCIYTHVKQSQHTFGLCLEKLHRL